PFTISSHFTLHTLHVSHPFYIILYIPPLHDALPILRAPGAYRICSYTRSRSSTLTPSSNFTRAVSEALKSSSPAIASRVTAATRSEEHTSELQSVAISYSDFRLSENKSR